MSLGNLKGERSSLPSCVVFAVTPCCEEGKPTSCRFGAKSFETNTCLGGMTPRGFQRLSSHGFPPKGSSSMPQAGEAHLGSFLQDVFLMMLYIFTRICMFFRWFMPRGLFSCPFLLPSYPSSRTKSAAHPREIHRLPFCDVLHHVSMTAAGGGRSPRTQTQRHRDIDTRTQRHTRRHTDTQTHRHTDTHTHTQRETHRDTQRHSETRAHTHTHILVSLLEYFSNQSNLCRFRS